MDYDRHLEKIVAHAAPTMQAADHAEMAVKPHPDKWSKKEILGHLIDSAYNNHRRFVQAQKRPHLIFDGYDQDAWVRCNDYQNRDIEELIQIWQLANLHLARLIAKLPEELLTKATTEHNFDRICMVPIARGVTTTLGYLVEDYIVHLEHHLLQILPGD